MRHALNHPLLNAVGFLFAPAMIGVFWYDLQADIPIMLLVFFGVMPLLRVVWPIDQREGVDPDQLNPVVIGALYWLPVVFACLWMLSALYLPFWADVEGMTSMQMFNMWMATWIMASIALAPCHELVHRKHEQRLIGRLLGATFGLIGFAEEHHAHHLKSGRGRDHDCADVSESIYVFVVRSAIDSWRNGWEYEIANQMRHGRSPWTNYIVWTTLYSLAVFALWTWSHGLAGAAFYLSVSLAVNFSLRAITFIQHWGLRDVPQACQGYGMAWSSPCAIQGWVLFGLPYHEHHHQGPGRPYWQLRVAEHELILPVTYPVCFLLSLVPPLYRAVMNPRLQEWQEMMRTGEPKEMSEYCLIPRR